MGESGWFPLEELREQAAGNVWYVNKSTTDATAATRIDSIGKQDISKEPSMWAISFQQLLDVKEKAVIMFRDNFGSKTMRDINKDIIIPVCQETKTAYALSKNIDGLETQVFVSHGWDEPFGDFVDSIQTAFITKFVKPTLWICAFALLQGNHKEIKEQLGPGETSLEQSPFVKALKGATLYLVVRNCNSDLCDRIWVVCEIMYAKKYSFIPNKALITGPGMFADSKTSCLDAKCYDLNDKARITKELLNEHSYEDIDKYINTFRSFSMFDGAAVGVHSPSSKSDTLEGFLGKRWFSVMKTVLDEVGVEELEDLKEINKEEIDMLATQLKGLQARKFVKKINELHNK